MMLLLSGNNTTLLHLNKPLKVRYAAAWRPPVQFDASTQNGCVYPKSETRTLLGMPSSTIWLLSLSDCDISQVRFTLFRFKMSVLYFDFFFYVWQCVEIGINYPKWLRTNRSDNNGELSRRLLGISERFHVEVHCQTTLKPHSVQRSLRDRPGSVLNQLNAPDCSGIALKVPCWPWRPIESAQNGTGTAV